MSGKKKPRPNLMLAEKNYARLIIIDSNTGQAADEISTRILGESRYVRIDDDSKKYPHLSMNGKPIVYHGFEALARDCSARLFKTRENYERAKLQLFVQKRDDYDTSQIETERESGTT